VSVHFYSKVRKWKNLKHRRKADRATSEVNVSSTPLGKTKQKTAQKSKVLELFADSSFPPVVGTLILNWKKSSLSSWGRTNQGSKGYPTAWVRTVPFNCGPNLHSWKQHRARKTSTL
jgi:hypothetical protein